MKSINCITEYDSMSRRLAHQVTWTQEKVLWELIECANDFDYAENYRFGRINSFGFNPSEIRDLISKVSIFLNQTTIPNEVKYLNIALNQFESVDCITPNNIDVLHNTLGNWSMLMTDCLLDCEIKL